MKRFYIQAIPFWLILLFVALFNALIRETTYKPLLTPMIGMWAHQISSLTGILLFFSAIYLFLKHTKTPYTRRDLLITGFVWIGMTIVFESGMNMYVRKLTFDEVLQTYYFWKGDTWIFVLISLVVSPLVAERILRRNR